MKARLSLALMTLVFSGPVALAAELGGLVGISSETDAIYQIDPATGAATFITGTTENFNLTGATFADVRTLAARAEAFDTDELFNCIPFGCPGINPLTAYVYSDIESFTIVPGDLIAFDLSEPNDVDLTFDIYLGATTSENGNVLNSAGLTQIVVGGTAGTRGDTTIGNYEVAFEVDTGFSYGVEETPDGERLVIVLVAVGDTAEDSDAQFNLVGGEETDSSGNFTLRRTNLTEIPAPGDDLGDGILGGEQGAIANFIIVDTPSKFLASDALQSGGDWLTGIVNPDGSFQGITDQGGSPDWHALATVESSGLVYTVDVADETHPLITLDPSTAELTTIGEVDVDIRGLAYDDFNGVLYGIGFDGNLYTLDTATAAPTLIGATGIPSFSVGLAYDEQEIKLYANSGGTLYEVNVTTGAATSIGANGASGIDGMAWLGAVFTEPASVVVPPAFVQELVGVPNSTLLDPAVFPNLVYTAQANEVVRAPVEDIQTLFCITTDPRFVDGVFTPRDLPLDELAGTGTCPADLSLGAGVPIGLVIPPYARGFANTSGQELIGIGIVDASTTVLRGLAEQIEAYERLSGFQPTCATTDLTRKPFTLDAPIEAFGEVAQPEGTTMVSSTYTCNRPRSLKARYSGQAFYMRLDTDVLSPVGFVLEQTSGLSAYISSTTCITSRRFRSRLARSASRAASYLSSDPARSVTMFENVAEDVLVELNKGLEPGDPDPKLGVFSGCLEEVDGELIDPENLGGAIASRALIAAGSVFTYLVNTGTPYEPRPSLEALLPEGLPE